MEPVNPSEPDRGSEWFVPKFGPPRFRRTVGLLFLPYTGMVMAYAVLGSLVAEIIHWDRLLAIALIYFLGLGIGAHCLDALGSKAVKPWGEAFSRQELKILTTLSLFLAYAIGVYYIVQNAYNLAYIALAEGFFVFAYNLEWFGGRYHTDGWFAFSWGFLPALAGHLIQTNTLSLPVLLVALSAALLSRVEITASRPYKRLKRRSSILEADEALTMERYEIILKSISLGVILMVTGLLLYRSAG